MTHATPGDAGTAVQTGAAETDNAATRTGWAKATPYVMIAVYLLGPLFIIPAFGGQAAVIPVIILIFGTAAVAGFIDGATFRFTWSLPILAGVGFFLAKLLYFNDGTFIYTLGCVLTAALCAKLGSLVARRG